MMWPPSILSVRVRWLRIWIPVFLIWPLAAMIWIFALPFLLLVAVLCGRGRYIRTLLLLGPAAFGIFVALRGLRVDIHTKSERVYIVLR